MVDGTREPVGVSSRHSVVDDRAGTVHAVHADALAVVVQQRGAGVDSFDGQVRPDRLTDVVDAGLEDLVRTHHALGADVAEVLRTLRRAQGQEVRRRRARSIAGRPSLHTHTRARARPFNGPFSGTTRVSRYQGPDLQNILRQSYDNAIVTIDLRRTSNLQNILRMAQGFS